MNHNPKEEDILKVEIINKKLVISIGLEALAFAVEYSDSWPIDEFIVDPGIYGDYKDFGESIVQYLEFEEEDGTTPVHRMLDSVVLEALEQGAEGFLEVESDE